MRKNQQAIRLGATIWNETMEYIENRTLTSAISTPSNRNMEGATYA